MGRKPSPDKVRARIAAIVEKLPEGQAVRIGEHMSLEVRKRRFGWFLADHHGDGRLALSCKAPALVASQLQTLVPKQFHVPKYVGSKGWIGLWLDVPDVDWGQVELCLIEAYRMAAPKRLAASL
ncbi:MAG: MmcQ/YjbR family DNA-binding protein [Steroidobacter sp.]